MTIILAHCFTINTCAKKEEEFSLTHSAPAKLKSNFFFRLNSSSSGSSFVQQNKSVIANNGDSAKQTLVVLHAKSIAAADGSAQSTSKKPLEASATAVHATHRTASTKRRVIANKLILSLTDSQQRDTARPRAHVPQQRSRQ